MKRVTNRTAIVVLFIGLGLFTFQGLRQTVVADQPDNPGPRVSIVSPLPLPVSIDKSGTDPLLVRDVDRGQPFQKYETTENGGPIFGPVPAGERWIIEHISVALTSSSNFVVSKLFVAKGNIGGPGHFSDFLVPLRTTGTDTVASAPTKFIVDPGEDVGVEASGGFGGNYQVEAFISGVIVPVP
jgi:hypothetical protein